jgi:SH3-like domain-containing protein
MWTMALSMRVMAAVLLLLVGVATLTAASEPALADFRVVRVAGDNTLALRAWPAPTSRVLRRIPFNARGIVYLGKDVGGWRNVRYRGTSGWVNGFYIQGDDPGERTYYAVVKVAPGDRLKIRVRPSMNARVIGSIPRTETGVGSAGPCTARWCKISYGGVRGWVGRKYLAVWIP